MDTHSFIQKCCNENIPIQETLFSETHETVNRNTIENELNTYLKKHFHYNIVKWDHNVADFPDYMFLGGDRGILAYIVYRYFEGNTIKDGRLSYDVRHLINMLRYAKSKLDRPIFFINLFNNDDESGLLFETDEQILDRIYCEQDCIDTEGKYYFPDVSKMGNFANLNNLFADLKKNSVRRN